MRVSSKILFIFIPSLLIILFSFLLFEGKIFAGKDLLFSKAEKAYKNWDNYEAEKILDKIHSEYPDNNRIALLYANTLLRLGNLKKSRMIFLSIEGPGMPLRLKAILGFARTDFYLNKLKEADDSLQKAEDLAEKSKDSASLAAAYNIEGLVEFNKLNYKNALRDQYKSLRISRQIKNKNTVADALRQIGVLYWYSSKYDSAIDSFYKPALTLYRETGNKKGEATALSDIGLVYKDKEKLEQNINYQLKAFGIRKEIGDKIGLADSYYFLSNSISMAGWRGSVIYAYTKKSFELSKEIGYKWGMEVAGRSLENYYYENGELPGEIFSRSAVLEKVGEGVIYRLWNKAKALQLKGNLAGQAEVLEKLIMLEDSLNYSNGELIALARLSSVYTYLGRYDKARITIKRSGKLNGINRYADYILDTTEARLYVKESKSKKAERLLFRITRTCDSSYLNYLSPKNNRITGDNLSIIQKQRSTAYSMLADVLYRLHDKRLFEIVQKELPFTFWFRSNTSFTDNNERLRYPFEKFVELLDKYEKNPQRYGDIQELTDRFENAQNNLKKINKVISDISLKEKKVPVISVDAIKKKLKGNDLFVEYFMGKDNVFAFAIRKNIFKILRLKTSPPEINSLVGLYISLIKRGYNNPDDNLWTGVSGKLCQILIMPLINKGLLKKNDHIIISPHRILYTLPFQTLDLLTGDSQTKFLVEKYDISYLPSPAFLLKKRERSGSNFNSLIAVAPDTIELSGTGREISYIPRSHFLKYTALINQNAVKSRVIKAFGQYDIVHIAAHARCNIWFPLYSYINCGNKDLRLYEILNEKITAKLVILSSCETGLGISTTGGTPEDEDFLSFSRAFLLKGADNVISSFWIVNDRTTSELMKNFYRNLFPVNHNSGNITSVELALNEAQRQFIEKQRKSGNSIHPFYWGAFYDSGISR